MKKNIKKIFLSLIVGIGLIITYVFTIRMLWGTYPKSIVLTNLSMENVNSLKNEIGFILPNHISIKSAFIGSGRDSEICVCLVGADDVKTFINDCVYIKNVKRINESFYSPLRKAWISDCQLYAGNSTIRDINNEVTVVGYYLNNEYYIEIYVEGIYEKNTYKLLKH